MSLGSVWAGRVYGTNTGNVFLKLSGEESALSGRLYFNDTVTGATVFNAQGNFQSGTLTLVGDPITEGLPEGVVVGQLFTKGTLNERGEIDGEWETSLGTAGTFHLFPHDHQSADVPQEAAADQLHIARFDFGPIEIDRGQIIAVAEDLQREFDRVVVTVIVGTEQSRFLEDFKLMKFSSVRATYVKLFATKPDRGGINQVVTVEFGQQANWVMTQGTGEAWVLGKLETLKRNLVNFERIYATNVKRLGIGINQLLLFGAVVVLPNLSTIKDRAILLGGVVGLTVVVNWAHNRYLPHTTIYLEQRKENWLLRLWPSIASWLIALTAGAAGTILAVYLQGWLNIPNPPVAKAALQQNANTK